MKKFALILSLMLACGASLLNAQSNEIIYSDELTQLAFPKKIGEWSFNLSQKYDEGWGYSIKYKKNDSCWLDIYVYDMNIKDIADGVSPVALKALDSAISELKTTEKEGKYRNVKVISIKTEMLQALNVECLRAKFEFEKINDDGSINPVISQTILAGYSKHFFKIRISFPKTTEKQSEKGVAEFLSKLKIIKK